MSQPEQSTSQDTRPAAPAPAPNLADQYEVGDASTSGPAPAAAEPGPGIPAPPAPAPPSPRDPDTGRFVKPSHPRYLAQMAKEAGLSDEDIAGSDPEVLAQTVYHIRRRESALAETFQQAFERDHPRVADPAAADATSPTPPAAPKPEPDADLGDFGDFDPRIQGLAATVKKLVAENKALREQVGQVHGHVQNQARQTLTQQIDTAFAKHKAHVGDGKREDLQAGDPMLARREAVLRLAQSLKGASLSAKIDQAVETLYGKSHSTPPTPPADPARGPSAAEWDQAALAVPTQRAGAAEPPGERRAIANVERYMKDQAQSAGPPVDLAAEFPV